MCAGRGEPPLPEASQVTLVPGCTREGTVGRGELRPRVSEPRGAVGVEQPPFAAPGEEGGDALERSSQGTGLVSAKCPGGGCPQRFPNSPTPGHPSPSAPISRTEVVFLQRAGLGDSREQVCAGLLTRGGGVCHPHRFPETIHVMFVVTRWPGPVQWQLPVLGTHVGGLRSGLRDSQPHAWTRRCPQVCAL